MRIDGKKIARTILRNLSQRVQKLKKKGITPHLAIILIGDNPASAAYVWQKELKAKEVGVKMTVSHLPLSTTENELVSRLNDLNHLSTIHGIIVQRPLPEHIDGNAISLAIVSDKDVDGFHPKSKFSMPLAAAVLRILETMFKPTPRRSRASDLRGGFLDWLKTKKIVVIGKGETGGGAVIKLLRKMGIEPKVIDSKTPNPKHFMKTADIIISAVGKQNIINANMIKKGVVLIGIGLHKGADGKLHGDYEEEKIKNTASFYTPTPGGVGPVNVAMLLANLVESAEN